MFDAKTFERDLFSIERQRASLRHELLQNKSELEQNKKELGLLQKVHAILENVEENLRGGFIAYIEEIISFGLSLVFSEKYQFKIYYKTRANIPAVDFKLVSKYGESDIFEAQGGGLVNVVSFLLRMLLLVHSNPPLARIMFLDESFSKLSQEYIPNLSQLLKEMSARMDMSFVLISHQSSFSDYADRIYGASQKDGITQFQLIKKHKHEVEGM